MHVDHGPHCLQAHEVAASSVEGSFSNSNQLLREIAHFSCPSVAAAPWLSQAFAGLHTCFFLPPLPRPGVALAHAEGDDYTRVVMSTKHKEFCQAGCRQLTLAQHSEQ